jgi:hypothetical protein
MDKLHTLVGGCLADFGMSMPEVSDSDTRSKIQHPPTIIIKHPRSLAFCNNALCNPGNTMVDVLDSKGMPVVWWICIRVQRPALYYRA